MVAMFGFLQIIIFGENGFMRSKRLKAEYQQIELVQESLKQKNKQLDRTIKRLKKDPEFIEVVARREFRMARPDDVVFMFKHPAKNN
jgi:cell division protein FtsB